MTQLNFDASQVDPSVPFEVLPSDKYIVEITKSEMKPTKAGDGAYLELEYTVLGNCLFYNQSVFSSFMYQLHWV